MKRLLAAEVLAAYQKHGFKPRRCQTNPAHDGTCCGLGAVAWEHIKGDWLFSTSDAIRLLDLDFDYGYGWVEGFDTGEGHVRSSQDVPPNWLLGAQDGVEAHKVVKAFFGRIL